MTAPRPAILFTSFFSSVGALRDDYHTLARALAPSCDLYLLSTSLFEGFDVPGAAAVCYAPLSRHEPTSVLRPSVWRTINRFIRQRAFQLHLVHTEHPLHVPVAWRARALRTVFWCHDPAPHSGSAWLPTAIYEVVRRALAARADRVVVGCNALKAVMTQRYRTRPDRIAVWPQCRLDALFHPELEHGRRDLDVLFFGRMERYKGLDVLLKALRQLREQGLVVTATLAGPGPAPPASPGVTVINRYLPDRELASLIARARLVVLPYLDATGTQAPQAALAYGTPVIASAVGCLPEYLGGGDAGLLVPPGDAAALAREIRRALSDATLWERLSANARRVARTSFVPARVAASILAEAAG